MLLNYIDSNELIGSSVMFLSTYIQFKTMRVIGLISTLIPWVSVQGHGWNISKRKPEEPLSSVAIIDWWSCQVLRHYCIYSFFVFSLWEKKPRTFKNYFYNKTPKAVYTIKNKNNQTKTQAVRSVTRLKFYTMISFINLNPFLYLFLIFYFIYFICMTVLPVFLYPTHICYS